MTLPNETSGNIPPNTADDYLWDGSGEPDPEIRRLEGLLSPLQQRRPAPPFPQVRSSFWRTPLTGSHLAAVAATAVILLGAVVIFERTRRVPEVPSGWNVTAVAGVPRVGTLALNQSSHPLIRGQTLETDARSRAQLRSGMIGSVDVDPATRLRLVSVGTGLDRLALERGTIHALIWAPAGQFAVDIPSVRAVDLGCAYTLRVDDLGAGLLRTSRGWVGFTSYGHESFIPAGAACATRPATGPGTPYFEDASPTLRAALTRFDFTDSAPEGRAADLSLVLAESRKRDALTLWHLLARVDQSQRALVFDRLAKLVAPTPEITREGVLRLDQAMLDAWWNQLGFDNIKVWRQWERQWSEPAKPAS